MQGSLPDVDEESDRVLRGVKSQAMYGKVREEVDRLKVYILYVHCILVGRSLTLNRYELYNVHIVLIVSQGFFLNNLLFVV